MNRTKTNLVRFFAFALAATLSIAASGCGKNTMNAQVPGVTAAPSAGPAMQTASVPPPPTAGSRALPPNNPGGAGHAEWLSAKLPKN